MPIYITVQDVRDNGVTTSMASNEAITLAIDTWEPIWERMCKQWFEPREATLAIDGTDSDTLHFPVPIISVTELYLNNSAAALDPTLYRVYNNMGGAADDRWNPRISLVRDDAYGGEIFTRSLYGTMKFIKGRQNQIITGSWGFVEADGSTPQGVRRALILLVTEKLLTPVVPSPTAPALGGALVGNLVEEEVDGHRVKFAPAGAPAKARPAGLSGISQNPEVRDLMKLYRAPVHLATPAHWSFG